MEIYICFYSIDIYFYYTENRRHDTRELGSRCHNGRRFLANPRLPQPQRDCRRGTAVVVNYLTGALLAFDHLSMRGDNPYELERICDCELRCEPWVGSGVRRDAGTQGRLRRHTAKAMESTILYNCFAQLADAGCHIEKNIEDGDGGSDKSFTLVYSGSESVGLAPVRQSREPLGGPYVWCRREGARLCRRR